jgi:hypothetical protein
VWSLVERSAPGALLLLVDGDVSFFKDPLPLLLGRMNASAAEDVLLMDDTTPVHPSTYLNSGFMLLRNTPATRAFGRTYLAQLKRRRDANDQNVFNDVLKTMSATGPYAASSAHGAEVHAHAHGGRRLGERSPDPSAAHARDEGSEEGPTAAGAKRGATSRGTGSKGVGGKGGGGAVAGSSKGMGGKGAGGKGGAAGGGASGSSTSARPRPAHPATLVARASGATAGSRDATLRGAAGGGAPPPSRGTRRGLRVGVLDTRRFANGYFFYEYRSRRPLLTEQLVAVHHNWIRGDHNKWERADAYDALVTDAAETYRHFVHRACVVARCTLARRGASVRAQLTERGWLGGCACAGSVGCGICPNGNTATRATPAISPHERHMTAGLHSAAPPIWSAA